MSNRRRVKAHRGRAVVVPGVTLSLGVGLGMGAVTCPPTAADTAVVELLTGANIRIDGAVPGDWAGFVAAAGDVNGDGLADVVIGAPGADNNGRDDSGSTYVVFGKASPGTVDLANLGAGGFRIDGAVAGDDSGSSVAGAGDVNGDGLDDVIVGGVGSGAIFLVFGKTGTAGVDLNALGAGGFRMDGAAIHSFWGSPVAGAGDVDGDGLDDVIIGAPWADSNGRRSSGSTYVVFGKTGTTGVDLDALGLAGFRIDGAVAGDDSGSSVAGAGDVNGDGLADVVIGAPGADNNRGVSGSSFVVFGRSGTAAVDLANMGAGGFRIDGANGGDQVGWSEDGVGDVNGDGLDDVIVGAPGVGDMVLVPGVEAYSGASYVVFGKDGTARVDLAHLGRRGFRIVGVSGDRSGGLVAGAGDVNGDGRADVIIGAGGMEVTHPTSYVVFGKPGTARVDLADLGAGGFRIDGTAAADMAGRWSVAGAGDVNGDGRADVIVGAINAGNNAGPNSGSSYIVFGRKVQAATVKVPRKIKSKGATVLLKKAVVTDAVQKATPTVTWSTKKPAKGTKKKYATVTTTRSGKITIRTTGRAKRLYVKLRLRAPAISGYAPYRFTATWTVKR